MIEILVVMFIASVGLSLVGPGLFGAYEKIARSAEEQKLADLAGTVSLIAFFRQIDYTMAFKEDTLDLKGLETTVKFKHIAFPPQAVHFNGNGYPDTRNISYYAGDEKRTIKLDDRF